MTVGPSPYVCRHCGHLFSEHQRVGPRRECFVAVSESVLCYCWDFLPETVDRYTSTDVDSST